MGTNLAQIREERSARTTTGCLQGRGGLFMKAQALQTGGGCAIQGGLGAGSSWREAYPGVVLGVVSGPVGAIYTQHNPDFMEDPRLEESGQVLLCVCANVEDRPHVGQVRFWRPARLTRKKRHVIWQFPSPQDGKLRSFFDFMGQKGVVWVKKRWFWVVWTKCEVADLKQRQGIQGGSGAGGS